MKIVYSDKHAQHDPQTFFVRGVKQRSAEQPERAERLLAAAKGAGHEIVAPQGARRGAGRKPCTRPTTSTSCRPSRASGPSCRTLRPKSCPTSIRRAIPRPIRRRWPAAPAGTRSTSPARSGRTPGTPHSPPANRRRPPPTSCSTASAQAYALCRPPGHHAYADMAGGFCFLNNTAIAAQRLRQKHQRVAVLDVDVHHGNGTQGIFFERDDVLTVSIHADPGELLSLLLGPCARDAAPARARASISTCRCRWARPTRRGSKPATRRWRASATSRRPRWSWRWVSTPAKAIRCRASR